MKISQPAATSSTAISGTGVANQIAYFTGAQTIGGSANLTFDGTTVTFANNPILTSMTPGSVVFIGTSKQLQQDNTSLFFNDTSNTLIIGGGSQAPLITELFSIQKNQNAVTSAYISNTTSGTAARASFGVICPATKGIYLDSISPGFTSSGVFVASTSVLSSDSTAGMNIATIANTDMMFYTNTTYRARFTAAGQMLMGSTTARTIDTIIPAMQIEGLDSASSGRTAIRNSNDNGSAILSFAKSRGTTLGSNTIVQDGDLLGQIVFLGADGVDMDSRAASITANVDGTPGSNDMPGRLSFNTTADGAVAVTERMRITQGGLIGMGTTVSSPNTILEITDTFAGSTLGSSFRQIPLGVRNSDTTVNNYTSIGFWGGTGNNLIGSLSYQITDQTNKYGDFVVATRSAAGFTEKMRVGSAGSVTIPTATATLTIGTASVTATATPTTLDMGGTYADTVVSSKAKWKLYNDGIAANTYGIGISVTQFNFFKATGGTYRWYFNDVEKMRLDGNGGLNNQVVVSPKVATPFTVLALESNSVYTNEGASAKIVFNLPTAVAGYKYTFIVQDADGIDITASSGDTIRFAGTVTAAAGTITSTTIGSSITLVAINATEWIATSLMGTWA